MTDPSELEAAAKKLGIRLKPTYWDIGMLCGLVVGAITFIVSWIYCIATYGFLFGVGLGWLPSLIVGGLAFLLTTALWGVVLALVGLIVLVVVYGRYQQELEFAFRVALGVAVCVVGVIGIAWSVQRFKRYRSLPRPEPHPEPGHPDYFDWANRRGKYADEARADAQRHR